jgi:hypothetical protein
MANLINSAVEFFRTPSSYPIIISAVFACITAALTLLNQRTHTAIERDRVAVEKQRVAIEEGRAIPEYLGVLKSKESPPYLQAVALSVLAKRKLISFDLAFEAAYQLEDRYGEGIVGPLIWQYRESDEKLTRPIGYLDASLSEGDAICDHGECSLHGWALGANEAMVWLDGIVQNKACELGEISRRDITEIFEPKYGALLPEKTGFILKLTKLRRGKHTLRLRLMGASGVFTEVFHRPIRFDGKRLTVETRHNF